MARHGEPDEEARHGDDQEREAADLFLQNNVILSYLNDDEWVDVHPAVAGMAELETAQEEALGKTATAEKGA